MANPSIIACTAGSWTKVLTAVKAGTVEPYDRLRQYLYTYRIAGAAAPTDLTDATDFYEQMQVKSSFDIDVYVYVHGSIEGEVRIQS